MIILLHLVCIVCIFTRTTANGWSCDNFISMLVCFNVFFFISFTGLLTASNIVMLPPPLPTWCQIKASYPVPHLGLWGLAGCGPNLGEILGNLQRKILQNQFLGISWEHSQNFSWIPQEYLDIFSAYSWVNWLTITLRPIRSEYLNNYLYCQSNFLEL